VRTALRIGRTSKMIGDTGCRYKTNPWARGRRREVRIRG
jgi:hypothetical protein